MDINFEYYKIFYYVKKRLIIDEIDSISCDIIFLDY